MSYCRTSERGCDVYCYYNIFNRYEIHVANCRIKAPKRILKPSGWFTDIKQIPFKGKKAAFAGKTFTEETATACYGRLKWLQKIGFGVPDHAFKRLEQEILKKVS